MQTYRFRIRTCIALLAAALAAVTLATPAQAVPSSPPTITSASSTTFSIGSAGSFTVTTTGQPAPTLTNAGAPLPSGVSFTDNGDGTATLAGTPSTGTAGTYNLLITAANGVPPDATQSFTLTVNQPPTITSASSTTFSIGTAGSFTVTTSPGSPASTTVTLTGSLPSGITFVDNGDGTATLSGTPAAGTGGTYPLTITASNGVPPDPTQSFTLTVNQAPAITSGSSTTFTVGFAGTFTVTTSAARPPSTTLTETGTLPSGVTFTDNGDGTATLSGTPAAGTGGIYSLSITASNGVLPNATQSFTLTVNQAPTFTSAATTTFLQGAAGSFTVTTTGAPVATTNLTSGTLPPGLSFHDNGDGTATLAGTPAGSVGSYTAGLTATNGVLPSATQSLTVIVGTVPTLTVPADTSQQVGSAASYPITTTGFPAPAITATSGVPNGLVLTDHGDGTATLAGTPAPGSAGLYTVLIHAASSAGSVDRSFQLRVFNAVVIPPPPSPSPSASPSPSPSSPTPSATPTRSSLTLTTITPDITPGVPASVTVAGTTGRDIELLCYTQPSMTYAVVRTAVLGATPTTFLLYPGRNTRCYARYAEGSTADASPSLVISVHRVLSLSASRVGPRTYVFQGRSLPRTAGALVTIYRIDDLGRPIRTAAARTDSEGRYSVTRAFLDGGTFPFLARSGASLESAAGKSRTVTLTIE